MPSSARPRASFRSSSCASPIGRVGSARSTDAAASAPLQGAEEGTKSRIVRLVAPLDHAEPPDETRRERDDPQLSLAGLRPHRCPRGDGRAEPRAHQLLDRLAIAQFHRHPGGDPAALEPVLDHLTNGAAPLIEDEWLLREIGRGEGTPTARRPAASPAAPP